MGQIIYKYQITQRHQELEMPIGSEIIAFKNQNNIPTIWALVNNDSDYEKRNFTLYNTGEELLDIKNGFVGTYWGTFINNKKDLVKHLFETF